MSVSRASKLAALVLVSACADSVLPPTSSDLTPVITTGSSLIQPGSGTYAVLAPMNIARHSLVAAALGGKIVAIGGVFSSGESSFIEIYDPIANSWSFAGLSLGYNIKGLMAAAWDNQLYVLGGSTFSDVGTDAVRVFNYNVTKVRTLAAMPRGRTNGAAVAVDGKIYAFGGKATESDGSGLSEVDVYDIGSDSWSQVAPLPRPGTVPFRAYAIGRKVYVWHWGNDSFDIYDIDGDSWSLSSAGWTDLGVASGGAVQGRIYMFKSYSGGDSYVAMGYDPGTDTWQTVALPDASTPALLGANATLGGKIYSIGGVTASGLTADVSAFTPGFAGNLAPTLDLQGPYRGVEGTGVVFDAGAVDPEGETLTYAWTFGDGGTSTDASPSHTFDDDGEYAVTVKVTDPEGRSRVASTRAVIRNVRPTVSGIEGVTVHLPNAYIATGTITDPGDEVFTATVDWGAGAGPAPHAVTGNSISLNHVYASPGYYNIVVKISDGDGGSVTVSRWVRVKPGVS